MTMKIGPATRDEIRAIVYRFFSEECDIDETELDDGTDIIEELEGDSLMLLALLELVRGRFGLTVELRTLGRHLMKKPADTIGQVIEMTLGIVAYGDEVVNLEL